MDWFRSYHGAPTDPKWIVVAKVAGVEPGVVAAVWWALMDHASQSEPRGSVTTFDTEVVAAFFGWEVEAVSSVLKALDRRRLIADGMLVAWDKRQPLREDETATERKRQQRKRERDGTDGHFPSRDVTQCHAPSRDVTPDREIERKRDSQEQDSKTRARARGGRNGDGTREELQEVAYAPSQERSAEVPQLTNEQVTELFGLRSRPTGPDGELFESVEQLEEWFAYVKGRYGDKLRILDEDVRRAFLSYVTGSRRSERRDRSKGGWLTFAHMFRFDEKIPRKYCEERLQAMVAKALSGAIDAPMQYLCVSILDGWAQQKQEWLNGTPA